MKKHIELYVGIFVLVGLIILGVMIIGFGEYEYLGKQYVIYAVFNFISGVVEGAPVRYAGVDVGKVLKATLFEGVDGRTQVKLSLSIKEGVRIKSDSEAVINSLGIIGEKYVELFPGSPDVPILGAEGVIRGVDPVALEMVMVKAERVLKELEAALTSVNQILTPEVQADIKATIVNFRKFGRDVDRLSKKIELVVNKINRGEGTVGQLIYAQELHDELLALIKGIREHGIFYKAKTARKEVQKAKSRQQFGPRK